MDHPPKGAPQYQNEHNSTADADLEVTSPVTSCPLRAIIPPSLTIKSQFRGRSAYFDGRRLGPRLCRLTVGKARHPPCRGGEARHPLGEARHPFCRVGSGEATRTWLAPVRVPPLLGASRPMPRTADTIPRAVSNRVRSGASPALARIGCRETLELYDGALSRRRSRTTLAGLESNRIPHLPLRPRLASDPLTYRNATCAAALP